MTKEQRKEWILEHLESITGLWENGRCKECNQSDDDCGCLAGCIRYWINEVKELSNEI